jgi:hypothetical protein
MAQLNTFLSTVAIMVLFVMIEIPKEVLEEDCNEATKKPHMALCNY